MAEREDGEGEDGEGEDQYLHYSTLQDTTVTPCRPQDTTVTISRPQDTTVTTTFNPKFQDTCRWDGNCVL